MKDYKKEIIKLSAKEVLMAFVDLTMPFFEASPIYRKSAKLYRIDRADAKSDFLQKIHYLKRHGMIETFVENKKRFVEITDRGMARINQIQNDQIQILRPEKWDGNWRVVIFDIPNKNKVNRDALRAKLIVLGFVKIQESVYVYPFECSKEIKLLSAKLMITDNVLIMVSEIIQGEDEIIAKFFDKGILNKNDLKK